MIIIIIIYQQPLEYFTIDIMNPINKQTPIVIIGAGIAGLSLAISLTLNKFQNVRIFQKDQAFQSRRQGYGLTMLQAKTALKHLGVFEKLKRHNVPSRIHYTFDQKGNILGLYGTVFWDHKNNSKSLKQKQKGLSMHVPRQTLRKVLIDRYMQLKGNDNIQLIKSNDITWNCCLKNIKFGHELELQFSNGINYKSHFIFGCDGIYSTVRQISSLQQQPLIFLKTMIVLGLCHSSHPLTKENIFQTRNGVYRFYSMPFLPFHLPLNTMWQLSFIVDLNDAINHQQNPQQLKVFIVNKLKGWHQPIPSMIKSTSLQNLMPIPAYDRDITPPKLKDKRVILIGDSIHPMSPFKSQGANQALLNSVYVGDMFSKCGVDGLVGIHSNLMTRTGSKVLMSRQRINSYHSKDYKKIEQYLYPPIDEQLIYTLNKRNINTNSIDLEHQIIDLIKQLQY